jgi:hypothetical protein
MVAVAERPPPACGHSAVVLTALRGSGLAHLLAISGLHLGLMAGTILVLLRAGLTRVPLVALRFSIKKWVASVALLAGGFYLFLAGSTVPTQRAFVMVRIMLLAAQLNRLAIVVLPLAPDSQALPPCSRPRSPTAKRCGPTSSLSSTASVVFSLWSLLELLRFRRRSKTMRSLAR